jgi:hypothetical protein
LISLEFPYYEHILSGVQSEKMTDSLIMVVIFSIFTFAATFLFGKLMPRDYGEPAFEMFSRKIALAVLASILIMIFSFHVLPVTDIITPGSPIQALFAPTEHFFWWLLVPLIGLFFL